MSATSWIVSSRAEQFKVRWTASLADWWDRLVFRCAGECCPRRGRFWPAWVRKSSALEFEGRRYCDAGCVQPALVRRLHSLLAVSVSEKPRNYRIPLGLLLVNSRVLSQHGLREALRLQREGSRGRLGDCLRAMGAVSDQQLTAALAQQWGCPVYPLDAQPPAPSQSALLPLPLLESARAFPVHSNPTNGTLHLAFADRLDHTTLYAVEQILGCRTIACVASESAINREIARLRCARVSEEPSFDTIRDPVEMARIIASYCGALWAARVAVARAASHVWVRFHCRRSTRDLLFRVSSGSPPPPERPSLRSKAFLALADTRKDGVANAAEPL